MTWLKKNDVEVPAEYGKVKVFPHLFDSTHLILIWNTTTYPLQPSEEGETNNHVFGWKMQVDRTGLIDPEDPDSDLRVILDLGVINDNDFIVGTRALPDGGFAILCQTSGSG